MFHSQTNGQVKWKTPSLSPGLATWLYSPSKDWNLHQDFLPFGSNTGIHGITNCTSVDLVLSQPTKTVFSEPDHEGIPGEARASYNHRRTKWLGTLINNEIDQIIWKRKNYRGRFKKTVRPTQNRLQVESNLFNHRAHNQPGKTIH